jgi:hypothetical protein
MKKMGTRSACANGTALTRPIVQLRRAIVVDIVDDRLDDPQVKLTC